MFTRRYLARLHAAELQHLRQHCAELDAQLDALQARNDDLTRTLAWAEESAECWRDDALRALESTGHGLGLTISGRLVALESPQAGAHA